MDFLKKIALNSLGEYTVVCGGNGSPEQSVKLGRLPNELHGLLSPFYISYLEYIEYNEKCSVAAFEVSTKDGKDYLQVTIELKLGNAYHKCKGQKVDIDYSTQFHIKELKSELSLAPDEAKKFPQQQLDKALKRNEIFELYEQVSKWVEDNWLKMLEVDSSQLEMFNKSGEPAI